MAQRRGTSLAAPFPLSQGLNASYSAFVGDPAVALFLFIQTFSRYKEYEIFRPQSAKTVLQLDAVLFQVCFIASFLYFLQ